MRGKSRYCLQWSFTTCTVQGCLRALWLLRGPCDVEFLHPTTCVTVPVCTRYSWCSLAVSRYTCALVLREVSVGTALVLAFRNYNFDAGSHSVSMDEYAT
jgi:hypothetical protein